MKSTLDINVAIEALSDREILKLEEANCSIPYLTQLNEGQRIAATRKEGNYLVIAGPGTGKTHTLVYRVLHLIKTGVDPKMVVIITFTRKAGNELKYRLNVLLPNTHLGFVGTFHAFANHISSLIGSASPISKFRLLDGEDDLQVHHLVLANFKDFKRNIRSKRVQKIMSYCCNTGLSVREYVTKFDLHELTADIENLETYKALYEKYKVDHMLANYDDMIMLISRYLEKDGNAKVVAPFAYLMIDEYQDTNQMQLEFVKKLDIDNVMAIGDDFQGIYAFRGADHRIILNFYNDFGDARMIKLTENYRSTQGIVDWVNHTTQRSNLGYQKELRTTKMDKGKVQVVSGQSLEAHRNMILESIKAKESQTHALIYRYNKNRAVFEKALINEQIEYSVYGGIRLLERKHIKDVLAFLMVYLNRLDVVSYNRILTLLPGVGPKTARKLIDNNLEDLNPLKGQKLELVGRVKALLESGESKEALFQNICDFYFSIYEYVGSEYYTKEDITEDFKLIGELMTTFDTLENFVVNIILDPVVDLNKGKNPKVVLTTIHSAKGLEFDNVYYFHSHDWFKNYDLEMLEEDRRLFYVGISRAKENLYVFDHTKIERSFSDVLRDFDSSLKNAEMIEEKLMVAETNEAIVKPAANPQAVMHTDSKVIKVDFRNRRLK